MKLFIHSQIMQQQLSSTSYGLSQADPNVQLVAFCFTNNPNFTPFTVKTCSSVKPRYEPPVSVLLYWTPWLSQHASDDFCNAPM